MQVNTAFKRPESVLVVVYSRSLVLLLQRRDRPTFWQSVTGSMHWQETEPLVSALRELKEETGLTEQQGQMLDCQWQVWFEIYAHWRYRYAPGTKVNLEHVFCFEVASSLSIALSNEHLAYDWFSKEEALLQVSSVTNRQAILNWVP